MNKRLLFVNIVLLLGVVLFAIFRATSNRALQREYESAVDFRTPSDEGIAHIRKIARDSSADATARLVSVAVQRGVSTWPQVQLAAIVALRGRSDPQIGAELATLLRPQAGLEIGGVV